MLRVTFHALLILLSGGVLCLAFIFLYITPQLPDVRTVHAVRLQVPLRIYSHNGSLMAEYGEKRRTPISINTLPAIAANAFVAAEDDRFYEHPGVDWQGIMRASYFLLRHQKKTQGGSTITMQLAKNLLLTREKTYHRKLMEIILALKIEHILSKDEILERYLNKIHFGNRAYGLAAAAQVYYGRAVNELDLAQITMLAGLLPAPSRYNPVKNPQNAIIRRNYVLRRMLEKRFITEQQFQQAKNRPVTASLHKTEFTVEAPYVAEMVRRDLLRRFGEATYTDGLVVTTSIQDKYQAAANRALRTTLLQYDARHGYRGPEGHIPFSGHNTDAVSLNNHLDRYRTVGDLHPALVSQVWDTGIGALVPGIGAITVSWDGLQWAHDGVSEQHAGTIVQVGDVVRVLENDDGEWLLSQVPEVQGSLVSLDVNTGALLALAGGFDFTTSKFNRATQARRQPGSGFKPFIYSAALANGKTAATIINDAPLVLSAAGQPDWRPRNYSQKTYGPTRLREALVKSRNLVSIRLLDAIGLPSALQHIRKFGFDTERLPHALSLALGSGEVSAWEMARGYSVFANGGHLIEPWFISTISTTDGEMIFTASPKIVCRDCSPEITPAPVVVDPRNIYIMNSMLQDVIKRGTGRKALALQRRDIGGKTGTTNDQRDAWFSGYNGKMATVCWVGFDARKSLGKRETGARAALPMWIDYMNNALANTDESTAPRPDGLVSMKIDPDTGNPSHANDNNAIFELFRAQNLDGTAARATPGDSRKSDQLQAAPEQLF